MRTSQPIIVLAAVLLLVPNTRAAPETDKVEPEFQIPKISAQLEDLATVAAAKQPAVF